MWETVTPRHSIKHTYSAAFLSHPHGIGNIREGETNECGGKRDSSLVKYFHSFSSQLSARRRKKRKILETSEAQGGKKACFSHQHLSHEDRKKWKNAAVKLPQNYTGKIVYFIFAVNSRGYRGGNNGIVVDPSETPFSHSFSFPNRVSGQPGEKGKQSVAK